MTYLPFGLCLWTVLLAAGYWRRNSRWGRRILIAGIGGMFLWAWPPVSALFSGSLEWRYRQGLLPPGDVEAIVVLAGSILPSTPSHPQALPGPDTYLRCRHAALLYRTAGPRPVLATGGESDGTVMADVMARTLEAAGVAPHMVWKESSSTSTHENAVYSARLLQAKGVRRIALVTHGTHMPRSAACFRKQGLDVTPAPVSFRSQRFRGHWTDFLPSPGSILDNEECLHEWAGLAWYRLTDRL